MKQKKDKYIPLTSGAKYEQLFAFWRFFLQQNEEGLQSEIRIPRPDGAIV